VGDPAHEKTDVSPLPAILPSSESNATEEAWQRAEILTGGRIEETLCIDGVKNVTDDMLGCERSIRPGGVHNELCEREEVVARAEITSTV